MWNADYITTYDSHCPINIMLKTSTYLWCVFMWRKLFSCEIRAHNQCGEFHINDFEREFLPDITMDWLSVISVELETGRTESQSNITTGRISGYIPMLQDYVYKGFCLNLVRKYQWGINPLSAWKCKRIIGDFTLLTPVSGYFLLFKEVF